MNKNILFVDDDVNLLRSYTRQFKRHYDVQTAKSGGEAIRILLEGKEFPVIISDYSMPLLNGIEFFEGIKNISPQAIKILVTGHADVNIAIDAINKGNIFRFITKPFDKKNLKKAIEDAFHQYKLTSIEKSDLLKNEFLNTISHEIRTPINGITNFIEIIEDELDTTNCEKVKPYFNIVKDNTDRLIRTIHLMTDISLVMSQSVELKYVPINIVTDVLSPLLQKHGIKAEAKNTTIDLNMDSSEYNVISDKYCIEQIFSNILDNALTFTNNGLVSINITEDESNLIIEFADNGIGMDENFLKKMYDPFIQEETGSAKSYDGNGLGLTLVKKYCHLLNIGLKVESKKKVGTTFQLTMKKE